MGLEKRTSSKRVAEKFGMGQERRTSGAEALVSKERFAARLKPIFPFV